MSADARSLLRATASARAKSIASEGGIKDPFASYNSAGALRCSACSFLPIKHESLWAAHAISKSHRANVARLKEEAIRKEEQKEQIRQAELERTKEGKRKASEDAEGEEDAEGTSSGGTKRARADDGRMQTIDPEWELFKQQLKSSEDDGDETYPTASETYGTNATIEVEPQLRSNETTTEQTEEPENEVTQEDLEAEERARKEQEEREEIYARYEEEQRLQDEADERVSALKQRLERIKQARLERQKSKRK